jgi:hypothetical protein
MFQNFRDPNGRFSRLSVGVACLLLSGGVLGLGASLSQFAGMSSNLPAVLPAALLALFGLSCIGAWWAERRAGRYDLRRLDDAPYPGEEPHADALEPDETGAPYCGWCDKAYAPGTHRCGHCGRTLS